MGTIIPVFIPHAGCPHQCVFCNQKTISGQKENGLEAAKEQIEKYRQWTKPSVDNEIAFYGGSFTALPKKLQLELLELGKGYLERGLAGALRLSTRPDYIDPEELELLKRYKVKTVELGAQSLDDEVLRLAERGHGAQAVAKAVALLKEYNFTVGLQLMVGLPGENKESFYATVGRAVALKPDLVRIYPLLVVRDTPLAKDFLAGRYRPLTLEEAVEESYYALNAFQRADISVIRLGLQPDEELQAEGNILAGPFHPAFGELVKSYGYKVNVEKLIAKLPVGYYTMVITLPRTLASIVRGQKNSNIKAWEKDGRVKVIIQEGEKFEVSFHDR